MKILISYDGSECSDLAIEDLRNAGLPKEGEAVVMSVAEVWLPPQDTSEYVPENPYIEELVAQYRKKGEEALAETQKMAEAGLGKAAAILPGWNITAYSTYGSPAWEVLSKADSFVPDLIVVGSHGHSAVGRFFLGSISQKILTEAHCSVRIARYRPESNDGQIRVAIGFDTSKGAQRAVEAVLSRQWPEGTAVRLITVTDPVVAVGIGHIVPPVKESVDEINSAEREWIERTADFAIMALEEAGLTADLDLVSGNPRHAIVDQAEAWNADVIFVGANAFGSRLERFLIGSTSAAVAARAECSVEVVRHPG